MSRRTQLGLGLVVVATLLATGCGSSPEGPSTTNSASPTSTSTAVPLAVPSAARLLGSWSILAMPLERAGVDKRRSIEFARVDDQLTALTEDGCNRQWGGFDLSPQGRVRLDGLGTTQAACPSARTDARHIAAIYASRTVGLDDRSGIDQLVFRDDTERIVLILQRIPPLSMADLLGTWDVVGLGDGSPPIVPLTMTFDLQGAAASVRTSDGCALTVAVVELSGQFGIRFTDLATSTPPCPGARTDDRLVRGLTQVRSANTDLTSDPQGITLVRRDGVQVATLERQT